MDSKSIADLNGRTLGSGNLRDVVKLPPGEDLFEWLAVNVIDLFHQVSMLAGTLSEFCTTEKCPKMAAGEGFEYAWAKTDGTKLNCSAPEYIDYTLCWVQAEIDNDDIFPSQIGKPFPSNFMCIITAIARRLFRIYAHVYRHHIETTEEIKITEHLNTSFKHFILFVQEFDLIDKRELSQGPLRDLIQKVAPKSN